MKKSLILVLSLPLLLSSCVIKMGGQTTDQNPGEQTSQTGDQSGTQTGGQSSQGTEGSTTGDDTETGGESTTGGGTETGGQTTGGGTETGGQTTGGGTETGGGTQTTSTTVSKAMSDCGFVNAKDVTEFNLAKDLKVTLSKGSNTQNGPKYYSANETLRVYGGNTITFSADSNITKIKLQITSDSGDNGISPSTGSISSDRTTWTGSAKSVTLTILDKSGKICITSISATYGGSGETTGGGTTGGGTTGGGTTGGGQTGGVDDGANYISTWPENYKPFVTTYLNGMLPCFLNTNKNNLFTGYMTGSEIFYDENENPYMVPYFNPYIKNTSPGINYEYDYGTILRNAGFKQTDEFYDDEIEATVHYYQKGQCYVQYNKHKGEDNVYYFDVYAYYDNYYTGSFKNSYDIQYDNKELALTNKYASNNKTVKVGNWSITMTDVMKSSETIQLKADTGRIVIQGSLKGLIIEPEIGTNAEALFVKAGTSASNAQCVFNNGGYFEFKSGTTYAEISANYRVLNIEYFDIIY